MSARLNNGVVVEVEGVIYDPGTCWAHFSDRQSLLSDALPYLLSIKQFDLGNSSVTSASTDFSTDHALNHLFQKARQPDSNLKWVMVSVEGVRQSDDVLLISGRCRPFVSASDRREA